MRKVSLLFAVVFAGLSSFAQYNSPMNGSQEILAQPSISKAKVVDNKTKQNVQAPNRAPGDVLYSFTFDSGLPTDWTVSDAAGIGGWEYKPAGTMPDAAQYANPVYNMINSTSGGGYVAFPVEFYNTVSGSNPPQDVNPLSNGDATMTTGWMDVDAAGQVALKYASWFRFWEGSAGACKYEIYVYINGDATTPAATLDGLNINGTPTDVNSYPGPVTDYNNTTPGDGYNCVFPIYNLTNAVNGTHIQQVKLAFRMSGTSHYYFSLDDVEIFEPLDNDIELVDGMYNDFGIFTELAYAIGGNNNNTKLSEVPANIAADLTFGGYLHQYGTNAATAQVDFAIDSAATTDWWTDNSNVIADFGSVITSDTVLVSDTMADGSTVVPEFYNTNLVEQDFIDNAWLANGLPYTFKHTASSTGDADADLTNNHLEFPFAQTWGRYSYHWQPTVNAQVSYNTWFDTDGYSNFGPTDGDIFTTEYKCYQDQNVDAANALKIYGLRFFLPADGDGVSFDANGDGAMVKPVLYYKNPTDGTWAPAEDVNTDPIEGDPVILHSTDAGTWIYLPFLNDAGQIDGTTFANGSYRIGVRVEGYNGQSFAIAVDKSYAQGFTHASVWAAGYTTPSFIYLGTSSGSVMLDMYTRQSQMDYDQANAVTSVVNTSKASNDVKVYPNPTTGLVKIANAGTATINVYSIAGNLVKTVESNAGLTTIDLSGMAKGTYLVKIVKTNEVITKKINLLK